jgi:ElaB/YqjD/DUF883 family membrane-anchored ribosome-binding protein
MKLKLYSPFENEIKYLRFFIDQGLFQNSTRFFKSFVECLLYPKILQLVGTDDILIKRYLEALQFRLGKFFVYTCGDKEFELKKNMSGLVVQDINKLATSEQAKLISHIKKSEYYYKRLIFITSEAIEINNLDGIDIISIPHSDEIKRIFPSFYTLPIDLKWKRIDNKLQESSTENQIENDNGNIIPPLPSSENTPDENQLESTNSKTDTQHPYQFIKRANNKIRIIFNGKESALRNEDLLGLHYLRIIIKYGIKGITYQEIEITQSNSFGPEQGREILKDIDFITEDDDDEVPMLSPVENFSGLEYLDKRAIDEIRDKIDTLEGKKEISNNELKFEEVEVFENEIKKLKDFLNKSFDIKGEVRKTDTELQKIKRKVKKNIKTALDSIKKDDITLYQSLNKSIKIDKNTDKYIYTPDPDVDWILDQ